jgi:plastocyanin
VNAFHVLGALFALWAVIVAVLGITRERFPGSRRTTVLVGGVSVILAMSAVGAAVATGISESNKKKEENKAEKPAGGGAAAAGGGQKLQLAADKTQLKFDKTSLSSKAGKVTIDMKNPAPIPHDVSIEGQGVDQHGKQVTGGGTSTVTADLKPGTYTFYCSVPGHRQAGMEGTLSVT